MRTVLALALVALCFVAGVSAKTHHGSSPSPAQEERAWLMDASVVNVEENLNATNAANGWVLYKQCGESWSNDRIGTSSNTICGVGCAMSSVAMALKTKGTDVNPGTLNKWLIGHGGYVSGDLLVWGSVSAFGSISFYNYYHGPGSMSQSAMQSTISKGWPIIANVRGGSHWVLVTGHAGGSTYSVNDPGFSVGSYDYSGMSNFVVYSAH